MIPNTPIIDAPAQQPLSEAASASLYKALNRAPTPIVLYDDNFQVIYANEAARRAWPDTIEGIEAGLTVYEATCNQVRKMVPDLTEAQISAIASQTIDTHKRGLTNEVQSVDGRWFTLIHDHVPGEYICGVGMDISELKHREGQLESAREIAEEATRAKSDFLARMSHEVKTPLNAILGMSDALLDDDISDETRETLSFIITAAEGLTHVLDQTLEHAKMLSDKVEIDLQPGSPSDVVTKICGLWKSQCDVKGISLSVAINPNVPDEIIFDRFRYQQCLNNLLSNAVKFTHSGGIKVVLKLIEAPGRPDRLALAVRDTGIGMDAEGQARIFTAYDQAEKDTTRRFGGTGLGMTITKNLIDLMDGQVSVKSEVGQGTTFIVAIPAKPVSETHFENPSTARLDAEPEMRVDANIESMPAPIVVPPLEETIEPAPKSVEIMVETETETQPQTETDGREDTPFSGLDVLCVEDNPVNQAVLKKLLGGRVRSLAFANHGQEGLEMLTQQSFDVVLMDIHMPVMDGIEATIKIRASDQPWANVCIIAVTADPDYRYKRICRNIGMNDAVGKPVKRKDILAAIERSIDALRIEHTQKVTLPVDEALAG